MGKSNVQSNENIIVCDCENKISIFKGITGKYYDVVSADNVQLSIGIKISAKRNEKYLEKVVILSEVSKSW